MAAWLANPVAYTVACSPAGPRNPAPMSVSPSTGSVVPGARLEVVALVPPALHATTASRAVAASRARRMHGDRRSTRASVAASGDEDDAADGLAALEEGVGGRGLGERERPVDEHAQLTRGDVVDQLRHQGLGARRDELDPEEHPGQRVVPGREHRDVERL